MNSIAILKTYINNTVSFILAEYGFKKFGYSIVHHMEKSTDDTEIWKNYWAKHHPSHHFPSEPHKCPSCLKICNDFVGGHVISEGHKYIIPVCRKCNSTFKKAKANKHFFYVKSEDMVKLDEK